MFYPCRKNLKLVSFGAGHWLAKASPVASLSSASLFFMQHDIWFPFNFITNETISMKLLFLSLSLTMLLVTTACNKDNSTSIIPPKSYRKTLAVRYYNYKSSTYLRSAYG